MWIAHKQVWATSVTFGKFLSSFQLSVTANKDCKVCAWVVNLRGKEIYFTAGPAFSNLEAVFW